MGTTQGRAVDFAICHTRRLTGLDWREQLRASGRAKSEAAETTHLSQDLAGPAPRFLEDWKRASSPCPGHPCCSLSCMLHTYAGVAGKS